ncbi:MAG: class SAM-dependent methyltransferase [Myxococcaceae bacterium]|nr:class SAM-dependent methyltransferase [Myxococcaceae bacterium]
MAAPRSKAREIALEHLKKGDALGWFDAIYEAAEGDEKSVPWADLVPNPALVAWLDGPLAPKPQASDGTPKRALVVGAGLGDDVEHLSARGYDVTGFDISERAVAWAKRRYPDSRARYEVADLLAMPARYEHAFDLVFEAYTLQSLPHAIRPQAMKALVPTLREDGLLVIVARARDEGPIEAVPGPPWALARSELAPLGSALTEIEMHDHVDAEPMRRWRATYLYSTRG